MLLNNKCLVTLNKFVQRGSLVELFCYLCCYFVFVFSQIESPNTCSVAELERQIDKLTKVKYLYLITDVAMDPPKSQLMKRKFLRFRI